MEENNMEENDIQENSIKSIIVNSNKKKLINPFEKKEKNKKRVETENWNFSNECYLYDNQLEMIKGIQINNYDETNNTTKITLQQINKKIYGYKQQDILKKKFQEDKFINLQSILKKMVECKLKCYYCKCEMYVLYDITREMKQWTVDRIDNNLGHNLENYYLACLHCNLQRRRRSDEKFLFTKQLKIIKTDTI
jgi:hypothetical protein